MKKIAKILLMILILTFSVSNICLANNDILVKLNDNQLVFDQNPVIVDGRTLVPLRVIFESLGATVEWEDKTQTVTAIKDDIQIVLQVNNSIMSVNQEEITLDVPPQIVGSRTLVPVRAISESFNCLVEWDGDISLVKITTENYVDLNSGTTIVYNTDGSSKNVKNSDVELYIKNGWATEPFVSMYSIDGRTIIVKSSEVEAYKQVGWYMTQEEAVNAGNQQTQEPAEPDEPEEPAAPSPGSGPRGEKPQKPEKPSRPPR